MANSSTASSGSGSSNGLSTCSAHPDISTYNHADLDTHIQELRHSIRTRSRYHATTVVAQSQESDATTSRSQQRSDPTQFSATDNSTDTRYALRGDAHIGQASHPDPTRSSNRLSVWKAFFVTVACVLAIGDGMGCGLMSLRGHDARFDRHLAVEISRDARLIARNTNADQPGAPRIVHSWHTDMLQITEQDVIDLGHNSIKQFLVGPPCKDFSKLRLIVKKSAHSKAKKLRPGLEGPHGKTFRVTIQILAWVASI